MRSILSAVAIVAGLTVPALAQNSPPSGGGLGSGLGAGGPGDRTGSVTATGQTKPPGDTLGPKDGASTKLDERSRELDRKIQNGICTGCK